MSKTFASVIALAAVAATFLSAHAGLQENGLTANGLEENGLEQNGLSESLAPNGDITALHAVRLVMPDGTELAFH
jgi:hypothetical protein